MIGTGDYLMAFTDRLFKDLAGCTSSKQHRDESHVYEELVQGFVLD